MVLVVQIIKRFKSVWLLKFTPQRCLYSSRKQVQLEDWLLRGRVGWEPLLLPWGSPPKNKITSRWKTNCALRFPPTTPANWVLDQQAVKPSQFSSMSLSSLSLCEFSFFIIILSRCASTHFLLLFVEVFHALQFIFIFLQDWHSEPGFYRWLLHQLEMVNFH